VRLSARIRSTALAAQSARAGAGGSGAHLEAEYDSDDEDPDSHARRKRRLAKSYISSDAKRRTDERRERLARAAQLAAQAEDECGAAGMDVDGDERGGAGAGAPPSSRRRKRTFFRASRNDVETLLRGPDPGLGCLRGGGDAGGLGNGFGPGHGFGAARTWDDGARSIVL